jgi:phage FluMu gp28-like protein
LKGVIRELGGRKFVINCNIDQGTLGYQLAEEMQAETGGLCQAFSLSPKRQGAMALRMLSRFQSGRIRVPSDPEDDSRADPVLKADFNQVQRVENGPGGVPEIRTDRSGIGHADRFWAIAMAELGMPDAEEGPLPKAKHVKPRGFGARIVG